MLESPHTSGAQDSAVKSRSSGLQRIRDKVASDAFLSGAGWLGMAQVIGRIFRLLTTLIVARLMTPEYFGLAAIALASNEIAHVVARFGTSAYIVQCSPEQLERHKHIANVLNWAIGISLFIIQCLLAWPIATWYGAPELVWPICVLALSYLMMPFGELHGALNQRNNRLDALAKGDIYQAIGDAMLTILLAVTGFGVWALILPKVLVVPLWVIPQRLCAQYHAQWPKHWDSTRNIIRFGRQVLGVELLTIFRTNIDVLIVGSLLGVHALGVYFFAMNAGLGITRSLLSALSRALYAYLCGNSDHNGEQNSATALQHRFKRGLVLTFLIVVPWVFLQASTAHWYVPIVFGTQWVEHGAVPILILFCLAGIPLAFNESASQLIRASGRPGADLRWYVPFTVLYTLALLIGVRWGIMGAAMSVLIVYFINAPIYYWVNVHKPGLAHTEQEPNSTSTSDVATQQ